MLRLIFLTTIFTLGGPLAATKMKKTAQTEDMITFKQAITALAQRPLDHRLHYVLGRHYLENNNFISAAYHLSIATELESSKLEYLGLCAKAYLKLKKPDTSLRYLEKARRIKKGAYALTYDQALKMQKSMQQKSQLTSKLREFDKFEQETLLQKSISSLKEFK